MTHRPRTAPPRTNRIFFLFILSFVFLFSFFHPAPAANSPARFKEVAHLDFDGDKKLNANDRDIDGDRRTNNIDRDIDGDGTPNKFDPNPFDPREDNNPYGVFCHFFREDFYSRKEIDHACKMISQMGAKWIVVVFMWDRIEYRQGEFRFDLSDHIVRTARKYNLNIVAMLAYSARWASSAPENASERDRIVHRPRDVSDFANYTLRCVMRYRNKIKYWQIWGEQNMPDNWKPAPSPEEYTELLAAASAAARSIDPSCKIIAGSLGGRMDEYLEELFKLGADKYFDIVGINPYINPLIRRDMFYPEEEENNPARLVAAKIQKISRVIEKYNPDKKLWITEMGCPGMNEPGKWWFFKDTPDPQRQARWLNFMYAELLGFKGIEKIFWYNFRTPPDEMQARAGLVTPGFKTKPAYKAYQQIATAKQR